MLETSERSVTRVGVEYSIILGYMGRLQDRFSAYHVERTVDERIAQVARITGVTGVEIVYPPELGDPDAVEEALQRHGLRVSAVNVNLKGDPRWHRGALTATDAATRREAVQWLQVGMDLAARFGCRLVTVCPLADGHDYLFEADYASAWRHFVTGIRGAADHRPDVRLSLEYKQSEPRAHVVLGTVGKTLYACASVDRSNVGVTLDMGHALCAGETMAESAALLQDAGKLFLVHANDNYRNWDWDLIPGSVNFWDLVEAMFYLRRGRYEGWVTFDVFPARLDAVRAMEAGVKACQTAARLVDRIGERALADAVAKADAIGSLELLLEGLSLEKPVRP